MERLKAVIFDLDGTIVDAPYNWSRIKEELETDGVPILSFLAGLEEPEKSKKWKLLEKYEKNATEKAVLKRGISELLTALTERGIKKALVTNNSRKNVYFLLKKFKLQFDCVITRESGLWKPSPAPFLAVLKKMEIKREECCVVGDSHFDIKAAERAGITKIYILSKERQIFTSSSVEVVKSVEKLGERIEELLW
ncbi:MAG: HAD family hydrolase [Candidatus Aminicenantaceae bacterium]